MDIDALNIFVQAYSAGSLAAAARRLKITPMAASRRLLALEDELGVRLMHRSTRSVSLTAEGEAFLSYATSMVETAEAGRAALAPSDQGATGLLRVTAAAAFGRKIIMPIVPRLLEENPALSIDIEITDGITDLVGRGMDVGIRIAQLRDSTLVARRLAPNQRILCAAPAYIERHGTPRTVADLANHDCITLSGVNHWPFQMGEKERMVKVEGRCSSNSIEGSHEACVGGTGLTVLSDWDIRPEVEAGRLVPIHLEDGVPRELSIWAVFPTARQVLPKVRVFVDHLMAALRS
ncbi:LysR family transcriptional regulator [Bradyrhizobium sp. 33ap4]|uniref:LysR family transcriptional regulator n=1 Tax=Bradyrhizobium sp. 33ap4 TaxID=3061630 RepID=UPI00293149C9|nr:LysR family transcriptional regulator [Bradyrhizobium sp. 33ap4]